MTEIDVYPINDTSLVWIEISGSMLLTEVTSPLHTNTLVEEDVHYKLKIPYKYTLRKKIFSPLLR